MREAEYGLLSAPIIEIEICQQKNENKCTYFPIHYFGDPVKKKTQIYENIYALITLKNCIFKRNFAYYL